MRATDIIGLPNDWPCTEIDQNFSCNLSYFKNFVDALAENRGYSQPSI